MSYIGNQPVLNTSEFREEFAVTSTQTVFNTGGFTASSDSATLEVLRNGVLLGTADYTLGSDASTVTLTNAAVSGDIIVIKGRRELTNGVQVTERRHEHTIASGETTVTFPYPLTVSQTDVYLNGVKLGSSDFSINSSTRVVSFTTNPAVGDLVAIVSREPALTANSSLPVVDASGNNVLSESAGVVTLTADAAVIEGSSSGNLVRITQTGSGNALVVEDSANPDSTPFVVDSGGYVGIATTSPATHLDTQGFQLRSDQFWYNGGALRFVDKSSGTAERMRIDSSGNLLVGYTSSNGSYKLQVNSQIWATSTSIANSDFNYKENITPLDGALSLVLQLNPVQFDWKEHSIHKFDRNQPTVGFIAQEVQQVLEDQPYLNSIVKSNECVLEPEETDEEGNVIKEAVIEEFLGIAEGNLVALLTKAVQEQQTIIESQQSQIDALTARIEALEAN